jgi:hypothetical protein
MIVEVLCNSSCEEQLSVGSLYTRLFGFNLIVISAPLYFAPSCFFRYNTCVLYAPLLYY